MGKRWLPSLALLPLPPPLLLLLLLLLPTNASAPQKP
jgi:hypothetical protein